METRASYIFIGSVVLIVAAFAFLFILYLGQGGADYDEYDIVFEERVSGLSVGAPVRFNGIQKGEVETLSIDPENPSIVIARVKVEDDTPVKTDTTAELELVGFTGLAIIQLAGGGPDKPLLKDEVRGIPRIEADSSGFAVFLEGSGDIVNAANRLLSPKNTQAVTDILDNIKVITEAVAENDEEINQIVGDAAVITQNLAETTNRLAKVSDQLEKLIGSDAPEAMEEATLMLEEARVLIADLDTVVKENSEPIALFTEQGLAQVGPAVAEARRLFRTLDQVLREVDRDPRGYLLGESTPRHEGDGNDPQSN
ncbi:MAG: MlaD family protein [Pseudomonadota bacterium]